MTPLMTDYKWQLESAIRFRFGSESSFRKSLKEISETPSALGNPEAFTTWLFEYPGGFVGHGDSAPRPEQVVSGLKQDGIDWKQQSNTVIESAENAWPQVALDHKSVLEAIKRVLN